MATDHGDISIALTEEEKRKIQELVRFTHPKKYDAENLIYEDVIYIVNLPCYWLVDYCYFNFMDNCNYMYELFTYINEVKPKFEFSVYNRYNMKFDFPTRLDFAVAIYKCSEEFIEVLNEKFGVFRMLPGTEFYEFRRKNLKRYNKDYVAKDRTK